MATQPPGWHVHLLSTDRTTREKVVSDFVGLSLQIRYHDKGAVEIMLPRIRDIAGPFNIGRWFRLYRGTTVMIGGVVTDRIEIGNLVRVRGASLEHILENSYLPRGIPILSAFGGDGSLVDTFERPVHVLIDYLRRPPIVRAWAKDKWVECTITGTTLNADNDIPIAVGANVTIESPWMDLFRDGALLDHVFLNHEGSIRSFTLGPRDGGTFVSESWSYGTLAWVNPSNAATSNNVYATATVSGITIQITHYLKATNFGFTDSDIPPGSIIDGILVEWEVSKNDDRALVDSERVGIVKGGTVQEPTRFSMPFTPWSVTDAYRSFGGKNDLWDKTWTDADIKSAGFGAALSVRVSGWEVSGVPYAGVARVDHVRITIYFTLPDGTSFSVSRIRYATSATPGTPSWITLQEGRGRFIGSKKGVQYINHYAGTSDIVLQRYLKIRAEITGLSLPNATGIIYELAIVCLFPAQISKGAWPTNTAAVGWNEFTKSWTGKTLFSILKDTLVPLGYTWFVDFMGVLNLYAPGIPGVGTDRRELIALVWGDTVSGHEWVRESDRYVKTQRYIDAILGPYTAEENPDLVKPTFTYVGTGESVTVFGGRTEEVFSSVMPTNAVMHSDGERFIDSQGDAGTEISVDLLPITSDLVSLGKGDLVTLVVPEYGTRMAVQVREVAIRVSDMAEQWQLMLAAPGKSPFTPEKPDKELDIIVRTKPPHSELPSEIVDRIEKVR